MQSTNEAGSGIRDWIVPAAFSWLMIALSGWYFFQLSFYLCDEHNTLLLLHKRFFEITSLASSSSEETKELAGFMAELVQLFGQFFSTPTGFDREILFWWLFGISTHLLAVGIIWTASGLQLIPTYWRRIWLAGILFEWLVILGWMQRYLMSTAGENRFGAILLMCTWLVYLPVGYRLFHKRWKERNFAFMPKDSLWAAVGMIALLLLISFGMTARAWQFEAKVKEKWSALGCANIDFSTHFYKPENQSLRELEKDLNPYGVESLYYKPDWLGYVKDVIGGKGYTSPPETLSWTKDPEFSKQVYAIINAGYSSGDNPPLLPLRLEMVRALSAELAPLYEKILAREYPRWKEAPEGFSSPCADFSLIRKLVSIFTADAILRLSEGDATGAEKALLARIHITRDFHDSPSLISQTVWPPRESGMILQPLQTGETWESLGQALERRRALYIRALAMRGKMEPLWRFGDQSAKLPSLQIMDWAEGLILWPYLRQRGAAHSCELADRFAAEFQFVTGEAFFKRGISGSGSILKYYLHQQLTMWHRFNVLMIVSEQTMLIRIARASYERGDFVPIEFQSHTAHGSKWKVSVDGAKGTVSTRLDPMPAWLDPAHEMNQNIIWGHPITMDGSDTWQFAPRSPATQPAQ